jgi:cytoskeletal protein CcmA (bactofilin family)
LFRRIAVIKKKELISILEEGLTVEGTISCKGKIVINGTIKGTLIGETVVIGKEGVVEAEMMANSVKIGGIFDGKIKASQELVILATGRCNGKVVCNDLVVEPGGILNARVTRSSVQTAGEQEGPAETVKNVKNQ